MPFVKLDTGILDSSLWVMPEQRIMFITALCMAVPYYAEEPMEEIETESITKTGFIVPPGFYGIVRASAWGIIGRTWPHDKPEMPIKELFQELADLACPDPNSRSEEFEGRRMVRVNGGFIILNFAKYREMDRTAPERSKRWRLRQKERHAVSPVTQREATGSERERTVEERAIVTQAEAEAEAENTYIGEKDNRPTTDMAKRIATLFRRRHTTPWSDKEIAAYRKIAKTPMEDFEILEEYYLNSGSEFLRRDVSTFLNNFITEVDRARAWKDKKNGSNGAPKIMTLAEARERQARMDAEEERKANAS